MVGDVPLHSLQFSQCPPNYHHIHTEISREGARVLALGYKELGHLTHQQVRAQAPHPQASPTSITAASLCTLSASLRAGMVSPSSSPISTFGDSRWHSVLWPLPSTMPRLHGTPSHPGAWSSYPDTQGSSLTLRKHQKTSWITIQSSSAPAQPGHLIPARFWGHPQLSVILPHAIRSSPTSTASTPLPDSTLTFIQASCTQWPRDPSRTNA